MNETSPYIIEGNAALCRYARTLHGDVAFVTYDEALADAQRTMEALGIEVRLLRDGVVIKRLTPWRREDES